MANIFRRFMRRIADRELGVLGDELAELERRHEDLLTRIEAFGVRYERLASRVGMRITRAARRGEEGGTLSEFERMVAMESRRNGGRGHEVDGDFPDFEELRAGR